MTIETIAISGWPVFAACAAILAAKAGAIAVVSGDEADIEATELALNLVPTVTVDSYIDPRFRKHLLVEAA